MSSTNTSGRPSGYISIPVEIIPTSKSHSRNNSPFRPLRNDNPYGDFSNSPPWKSSISSHSSGRFQPRQSPTAAYDRVIHNSHFNQRPSYQESQYRPSQQRLYEPSPLHYSRSSEDLLSSPMDSTRSSTQSQYTSFNPTSFRADSDFIQPKKYTSSFHRSYDALNDFPVNQQYPSEQPQQQQKPQANYRSTYQTQYKPTYTNQTFINPDVVYSNEYGVPTNKHQSNTFQTTSNNSHDRSRSPGSQRSDSPVRPPPHTSQQQQQQEPDIKQAKDVTGPIPMPGPATTSSSVQSNDQQVPSPDSSASTNAAAPIRDPNTIALEKLEQIKQSLAEFDQQVDVFTGSTRNDRVYKLLDEQALKIMIRCDELIDVSADIKEKRKEMIRNVQTILAKLESKVPTIPAIEYNSNEMETALVTYDPSIINNEQKESLNTEQSIST